MEAFWVRSRVNSCSIWIVSWTSEIIRNRYWIETELLIVEKFIPTECEAAKVSNDNLLLISSCLFLLNSTETFSLIPSLIETSYRKRFPQIVCLLLDHHYLSNCQIIRVKSNHDQESEKIAWHEYKGLCPSPQQCVQFTRINFVEMDQLSLQENGPQFQKNNKFWKRP